MMMDLICPDDSLTERNTPTRHAYSCKVSSGAHSRGTGHPVTLAMAIAIEENIGHASRPTNTFPSYGAREAKLLTTPVTVTETAQPFAN
jgi:hypothetical protein